MGTTILSFQNRVVIETLHNEGRSLRHIANYLGFSKATIFNELHRLNSEYQAGLAQTDFERKVSQRGRKSSHSITAAPLRSGLIKSKLARNSATLKLIPYFLANVKVKLRLLLWSVRVA